MLDKKRLEVTLHDGTIVRGRSAAGSEVWAMTLYALILGKEVMDILESGDFIKAGEVVEESLKVAASKELDEARKEVEAKVTSKDTEFAKELKEEISSLSKTVVKAITEETEEDSLDEATEETPTKSRRKASAKRDAELYQEQAITNLIQRTSRYKAFNKISISLLGRAYANATLRYELLDAFCNVYVDLPPDQYSKLPQVWNPAKSSDVMGLLIGAISAGFPDLEESK